MYMIKGSAPEPTFLMYGDQTTNMVKMIMALNQTIFDDHSWNPKPLSLVKGYNALLAEDKYVPLLRRCPKFDLLIAFFFTRRKDFPPAVPS